MLPRRALAAEFLQLRGRVLGVGSGHGLIARWLAEINPDVTVVGLDVASRRVAVAAATEERSPRVRIRLQNVLDLDEQAAFDAAEAVDLMHHIDPVDRPRVAAALARALRPGGVLLIKDIARTPRWKHAVNRLHDRVVAGEATTGFEPPQLAALFVDAGFEVERLYRAAPRSPYPHLILRARRPSEPPQSDR